jgi:putative monooxygenase
LEPLEKKVVRPEDIEPVVRPGRTLWRIVSPETTGTKLMTLLYVEFGPGESTAMHTHEGLEAMYILKGQGKIIVDGKECPFSEGSVLIAEPGVPHQVFNLSDDVMSMSNSFVPPLPPEYFQ